MSSKGFDYTEFKQFRDRFNLMYKQFDHWLYQFIFDEGMRFIAKVKPRTPVDTGDLRDHWQLAGITREGSELRCWFVNSMYYASFVEYGHAKPYKSGAQPGSSDWVDGYFMMTVSLDEIQRQMPARFDAAFKVFLTNLGVM